MYRPTDRQVPLFGAQAGLGASARERLRESWAEWFFRDVMPELLESEGAFAELYGDAGRPNWSVARLLGLCLLQHLEDLDDQRALDALSFDIRWQHALGLAPEDAYLSRRSLVEFRRRLVVNDPDGELIRAVFDRVCQTAAKRLKISTSHQRLDSTLISSNIRQRGRLSLARETVSLFLRSLDESQLAQVGEPIRAWFTSDHSGWEIAGGGDARPKLEEIGGWVEELLNLFANNEAVRGSEPYQLLARLFTEHSSFLKPERNDDADEDRDEGDDDEKPADPTAGSGSSRNRAKAARKKRKKGKKRKKVTKGDKARFWSNHDPDASFGHKGLGYHAHITETCRNESTELLTDYDVMPAAETDVGKALPVIERLKSHNVAAQVLYADGGYPTPAHLLEAQAAGTELCAPVHRSRMPKDTFTRDDFARDDDGQIVACPAGHQPVREGQRTSNETFASPTSLHVFFDATTCRACPHLRRCPVRQPNNKRSLSYRLDLAPELVARDHRWAEQQTETWRAGYRIRAGVEATMSELKRGHGLGRLRVRRLPRVRLQVAFKSIACNVKRWGRATRRRASGRLSLALAAILAILTPFVPPTRESGALVADSA